MICRKNRLKHVLMLLVIGFSGFVHAQPTTIRVLLITGGHDYNQQEFNRMFDSLPGPVSYKIAELPAAFALFEPKHRHEYNVIVFYHMWQTITAEQESTMADCILQGKPLVVLHHSICAFDDWDEYRHIIGGKYFHRPDTVDNIVLPVSSYEHDVNISIHVKDLSHPVTKGMDDFVLWDETYDDFYVEPGVIPLLTTDNPGSSPVIGWTKEYGQARVVTLQSGHDTPTFRNSNYRKLLWQAILWVHQHK